MDLCCLQLQCPQATCYNFIVLLDLLFIVHKVPPLPLSSPNTHQDMPVITSNGSMDGDPHFCVSRKYDHFHPTSVLFFPHSWLSGFLDVCWMCVCVCVVFPAQLFFQNKKPLTLSPPQKKNTRTNPHLQHGNVSKVASDLFILQGIEAHSLPSAINTGPGGKTKKSWKKQCRVLFFRLLFYPRNLT